MAYELEKIESEFKKIWKAIEELQMTRQARDEFRAEIWQAIEGLKEKQDIIENGPKVSVLCRKCNAENMVYDYAQWEYTCRKCGFDHANEYNEDAPKEPDYRALYEKEKGKVINITMFVFKLLEKVNQEQNHHEMISHTRSTTTVISPKKEQLEMILQKMQELEER